MKSAPQHHSSTQSLNLHLKGRIYETHVANRALLGVATFAGRFVLWPLPTYGARSIFRKKV